SANHTPFNVTCKAYNLTPEQFDPTFGLQLYDNNRSRRYTELMDNDRKISFDDFKRYKYDVQYPSYGEFVESLRPFYELNPDEHPKLAVAIRKLQRWNKSADVQNKDASLALLAFMYMFKKLKAGSAEVERGLKADKRTFFESVAYAQKYLLKHFKTIDVPLGEVQRLIKGRFNMPMYGMPDVLGAMFSEPYKKGHGRRKAVAGDSYIQFARYAKDGIEHIETVVPFGSSNHPNSPHYADQMPLFARQKTKTMTFNRAEIFAKAERVYHPD
ncbi:MAG: penicillin acylase family protein, partial [Bacteroidia bacterium]|nr:penicillin acylase family protein [Bacteroidia bacterium]